VQAESGVIGATRGKQTQNLLLARAWGFKSLQGHQAKSAPYRRFEQSFEMATIGGLCNFCAIASGFLLGSGARMFDDRSLLEPVQDVVDDMVLRVRIAQHHRQALMPRELLDGLDVGAHRRQPGDGGMAHRMRNDYGSVHAGGADTAGERRVHALDVPALGPRARENPSVRILRHLTLFEQDFRDATGEWLAIDLRPLDVDALRGKLEVIAKEAVENDPKRLKARIAELERELARKPEEPTPDPAVMRAAVDDAQVRGYAVGRRDGFEAMRKQAATQAQELRDGIAAAQDADAPSPPPAEARTACRPPPPHGAPRPSPPPRRTNGASHTEPLPRGERACLICAAQHDNGVTREQLTVVTGYKRSSRDAYIQRLRERGYVEHAGERIVATDVGIAALGDAYEPLPTGPALQDYHLGRLPEGERRVLEMLLAAYPGAVERAAIDAATGYKRSSRDAYLQRLGARQLVVPEGRGAVRASVELFE
jgi:hypothetical protein